MSAKKLTVEYVRQKFGIKAKNMTDKDISDLLNMLRSICRKTIENLKDNGFSYVN